MRPLAEARAAVIGAMTRMGSETVTVESGLNRITAEPVVAPHPIPPFPNSAMDGYAVIATDVAEAPIVLTVNEDVPAGSVPKLDVTPGTATRIMTGAPMPHGADAVAMVEITHSVGADAVEVLESVPPGTAVREAGSDLAAGAPIVAAGVRLTPRHLASIASATGAVSVARQPTVAIMSTGDEVVAASTRDLAPGMIRDTNRPLLHGLLAELSIPTIDMGIIGDDPGSLRDAYREAASVADIVVSTGGVSMGDYDYVKQVLGETGSVEFWKVAMQPAKPFAFGDVDGVPLFGLPGNPVSTFVAYEQFVRPALLHMMGAAHLLRPRIRGTMGEDITTSVEKEVFVRVLLADDDGRFVALRSGGQGSNVLSALAAADALAVIPVGVGSVSAGDDVTLEMYDWPERRGLDD